MGTSEFKKLVREILKLRKNGWTKLSMDLIRLLAKEALDKGEITQEEYDHLIKMLDDENTPPPPGNDRSNKNKQD